MKICPAYAGMILSQWQLQDIVLHLSRVCGDDPNGFRKFAYFHSFVPRMRG